MVKRIAAIGLIFVCTAFAWAILGTTIFSRTYDAQSGLSGRVASTGGAPQVRIPDDADQRSGMMPITIPF